MIGVKLAATTALVLDLPLVGERIGDMDGGYGAERNSRQRVGCVVVCHRRHHWIRESPQSQQVRADFRVCGTEYLAFTLHGFNASFAGLVQCISILRCEGLAKDELAGVVQKTARERFVCFLPIQALCEGYLLCRRRDTDGMVPQRLKIKAGRSAIAEPDSLLDSGG